MDKSRVKIERLLLAFLILGLTAGQCTAYNKLCYRTCFTLCIVGGETGIEGCVALCKKLCSKSTSSSPTPFSFDDVAPITDNQHYCTFGFATLLCTNLSTKDNPAGVGKLEACVDSCSNTCTKKNQSVSPSKND